MRIRVAFDFISPFAYFAWHRLQPLAARYGCEIEPVPVLFAGFLKAHGQLGPAEIPAKRSYLGQHLQRQAHESQIPLGLPPSHPFNPLLALRVASLDMHPVLRTRLITALFDEVWAPGGRGVTEAAVVDSVARDLGLLDVVARAQQPDAKARVRHNTDRALSDGAFGVPTMWVDEQMFWGADTLGHLEELLKGHDVIDRPLLQAWKDLPQNQRRTTES